MDLGLAVHLEGVDMKRYIVLEFDDEGFVEQHPADVFKRDCASNPELWSDIGITGYREMDYWPQEAGDWLRFSRLGRTVS